MRGFILFIFVATLAGCYGDGGGGDGGDGGGGSFTCEPSDRAGTYLAHYSERPNGTCGALPDEIAILDGSDSIGPTCSFTAPDSWDDAGCTVTRSVSCTNPDNGRIGAR